MGVGGAERQLCLLAAAQRRQGMDVHVALVHGGPHLEYLLESGVTVHRIEAGSNHDPRIATRLLALIRRVNATVVQSWLPQMDVFAGLASKAASRPWVLSERSMASAYESRWKDRVLRVALGRWAGAIVANSPGGLDYWSPRVSERTLLAVVPNALALDDIRGAPAVPLTGGPEGGEPFLLFAGRLSPEKNLPRLLEALALVAGEHQVRTVLCGEGPMRGQVIGLVERFGLSGKVTVSGLRTDLWGVMKSATALVSPSLFEGQPNVVLEAAAAGCPLVLSDIKGHRDVADERSAVFFRPDSPAELAGALLATLRDPAAASCRAVHALRVADSYSVERAVMGYQSIYDQLLVRYR